MLRVNTYVAASGIEGVGVFAHRPIRRGTLIWQFDPHFDLYIPAKQYESSPDYLRELLDRYAYPSPDRQGFLVYETDNGRFMNHQTIPNTDFSKAGGGWAIADIAAGEEITCDYSQFYEGFEARLLAAAG